MTMMMLFLQKRGKGCLLDETLCRHTAEVDDAGDSRMGHYVHHVEDVLHDIKHEVIFLLETRACYADGKPAIRYGRTKDGHPCFVCRREYAILRGNLGKFPT